MTEREQGRERSLERPFQLAEPRLEPLPEKGLAQRINEEHHACERAAIAAVRHALEAGRLLEEAKAGVKRGGWGAWLAENFDGSQRTAQVYMQLHANRAELEAQTSAPTSIASALRALRPPVPTPPPFGASLGEIDAHKPYAEWTPTERREDAERNLEQAQREDWTWYGGPEERARELERREQRVRILSELERLDWSGPNKANGFYDPALASEKLPPVFWLAERERTAEELLVEALSGARHDLSVPLCLEPPARNPYPRWLDGEAWLRVRARVLAHQREWAVRVVESALRSAKGGRSHSLLPEYRQRVLFLVENATEPELSGQASREKLTEYARLARGIAALYAGLADGLEGEQDG